MTDDEVRERLSYLSAAQHETNTPLAVIRGWAETFTVMWSELGDEDRQRGSDSMRRYATALTDLLDALFVELRADVHARASAGGTADLRELVPDATARIPDIEVDGPVPELVVSGDPAALGSLISAAAVGLRLRSGAPVTIGVTRDRDGALLVLMPQERDHHAPDEGAAPSPGGDDPFDPFPGGQPSVAGIRLYAARRLATGLGGRLTLAEDGQLRLVLPLA